MSSTKVTDAGLKHLAKIMQFRRLDLKHTSVSDAGLKELAGLKLLQQVYVSTDVKVTLNGMRELE